MRNNMKYDDPYKEAMRYIDNAKEQLKLAGKGDEYYLDDKYVKTACGTAYSGALKALDFWFDIRKVENRRRRKSIEYYRTVLGKMDNKLLKHLNSAYNLLHLAGYYDGETDIKSIDSGFEKAISIVDILKPYSKNGVN
jgi:hypothetical protein